MVQRFSRFLVVCILSLVGLQSPIGAEEVVPQRTEPSSEALAMIAQRMQSLSGSLGGMPQPPKIDSRIEIPAIDLSKDKKTEDDLESFNE